MQAKITLDQYMSYLRNALNSCYYCVVPTAFPEELQRKCVQHLRAPEEPSAPEDSRRDGEEETKEEGTAAEGRETEESAPREAPSKRYTYPSKSSEERWVENLDLKVRGIIDEDPDVVEYGGRDVEDETRRLLAPHIKQEEADKYRCKECGKLFRAPEFVMKHIISKHSVAVKDKVDEVSLPPNTADARCTCLTRSRWTHSTCSRRARRSRPSTTSCPAGPRSRPSTLLSRARRCSTLLPRASRASTWRCSSR